MLAQSSWPTGSSGALDDDVSLLALGLDERAIVLAALEDRPPALAELRVVLVNEHFGDSGKASISSSSSARLSHTPSVVGC
jgi:hypothetical protein